MNPHNGPRSMRDVLSAPLAQFETLTQQLFVTLSTTPSAGALPTSPPPSIADFMECDALLAAALDQARQHQIKQRRIEQVKEDIVNLEKCLKVACRQLLEDKTELETILRDGTERMKIIDRTRNVRIPADYILAYAHNLTDTTAAPLTNTDPHPDQPAPPAFRPPYPDDSMLRRGFLGSRAGRMAEATGETREVGQATGPPAELPQQAKQAGPYRNPLLPQGPPPSKDFGLDLTGSDEEE